ncbi:hypothetical protein MAPG_10621 [Magnaporthiopsis poae ATCC 64411]|uniref:Uncharacterized protein n=1 Tax=Magnaporthiopsis poae (strain ATCC 64411 / 73-15) TaxID=644358 RepID=A0A0C4ED28_MAGP6|nr:hypothetical protein MAPG_10621 [Magnaporthiopsis poae ATCC 64411]
MLAVQYQPPSMTRAANDSFLPSGAVHDRDDLHLAAFHGMVQAEASSVVSPLSLPRGATQYFDAQNHHLPAMNGEGLGPVHTYYTASSLAPASAQAQQQQQVPPSASSLARSASSAGPYSFSPSLQVPTAPKQQSQFISPRLAPTSTQIERQLRQQTRQQQRSASLSPTRRSASLPVGSVLRNHSAVPSPSRIPFNSTMMPLDAAVVAPYPGVPASVPIELPSASYTQAQQQPMLQPYTQAQQPPMLQARSGSGGDMLLSVAGQQAQTQKIALLEKQNSLIRQAWESERRYLEANRSRAEEVYQEERAIMDMERTEWEAERVALMDEIVRLKDQAKALRSGSSRFAHVESIPEEGGLTPCLRGGGSNGLCSPGSASLSPLPQHRAPRAGTTQTAAFQSQASYSHVDPRASAILTGTTHISPSRQPESSPFIPLTQQPQEQQHQASSSTAASSEQQQPTPSTMTSASQSEDEQPAPIIDVQDIHPELEGIPLKKTAVHRATFTDGDNSHEGSKPTSTKTSPTLDNAAPDDQQTDANQRKVPEKDPLKVLAAPEPVRLRMNAGHTPNHSLSVLPSCASTEVQTTASSSGEVTPTTATGFDCDSGSDKGKGREKATEEPAEPPVTKEAAAELEGAPTTAPDEDLPLKGPLHLRNLPAKDAKFFDLLDKKLNDVSKGETEDALPKVLQNDTLAGPKAGEKAGDQKRESKSQHSSQAPSPSEAESSLEIPLRIRKTSNFGAPLGEIRGIPPH